MKSPTLYLLDTNMFSFIADGRSPAARLTLQQVAAHATIAISSITEAEVLYGLARKPQAVRLRAGAEAMLANLEVLAWDSAAARSYANLRLHQTQQGKPLSALDTLIAAHAVAVAATLVTHDAAFSQVPALHSVVDWATDL